VSTWGTDETLLAHSRSAPPRAENARPAPTAVASRPVDKPRDPKPRPDKTTRKPTTSRPSTGKPKTTVAAKTSTASARKKADGFYQKKQFGSAAAVLRSAADEAAAPEAEELRALATKYEAIGASLDSAKENQSASPTTAMTAYRRALALDKEIGNSVHAPHIRLQLGTVAPLAAASYMAQKRYEAAKKAADAAVNYGAGANAMVKRVRTALERKAGEFYQAAIKTQKNNPTDAKKLLRRVIKMVPADSPWYAKAYEKLNARTRERDEDE
jgi:tetratricopeptide (TPR) repeat protein